MVSVGIAALRGYVAAILRAKGTPEHIAEVVAESLVLSNRRGHASHGFIRVSQYCDWIDRGWTRPAGEPERYGDRPHVVQVDGHFGFGQYVGRLATDWAIERARGGHCVLTIKRSGHLGRMGEFMEQAAAAGLVCFSFTNTHGGGLVTAPFGGAERRLSANPLAAGAPLPAAASGDADSGSATAAAVDPPPEAAATADSTASAEPSTPAALSVPNADPTAPHSAGGADPAGPLAPSVPDAPLMMDIATSSIAAGKVDVAAARGEQLEPGHLVNAQGQPSTDPADYREGAMLPFGGHKGYCLAMFCEVLAGALTGAGCSTAGIERVANGFMALFLDPAAFCGEEFYQREVGALVPHVKSAPLMQGHDEILYPGELEARSAARHTDTVTIEMANWERTARIAETLGVNPPAVTVA